LKIFLPTLFDSLMDQFNRFIPNVKYTIGCIILFLSVLSVAPAHAQHCSGSEEILAKLDFNSLTIDCNGADHNVPTPITDPSITPNATYCPNVNNGCGITTLGTQGHQNTPQFKYAICLFNFYNPETLGNRGAFYDPNATTFDKNGKANLSVWYTIPENTEGCLSQFSLVVRQKQFNGTLSFEQQGVAVKRNGVFIYEQVQPIAANNINGDAMVFTFSGDEFCSDGTERVEFEIVFGLVHRLIGPSMPGQAGQTGYDDLCVRGTCQTKAFGGYIPATCGANGPNDDIKILIQNFEAGNKYSVSGGNTYTGTEDYNTETVIPANGQLEGIIGLPTVDTTITVRVFQQNCFSDFTVTIPPQYCCVPPTANISAEQATCDGETALDDASIKVSLPSGSTAAKVAISSGSTFSGAGFAGAQNFVNGEYTFSNLPNPLVADQYTIRVYTDGGCFVEFRTQIANKSCIVPCTPPSGATLTSVDPTCSGATLSSNGSITINNVSGGDKVGYSPSISYSGPHYENADVLVNGSKTYSGILIPDGGQIYTIRVFNTSDGCYIDQTVELADPQCGLCANIGGFVTGTGLPVPEGNGSNNQDAGESCENGDFIDLALTKTVTPSTGMTCVPGGTDFVWTLSLTNNGNITATGVNVVDLLPAGLVFRRAAASQGQYYLNSGWDVGDVNAGQTVTLDITTVALNAGTYTNCAYVNAASPANDPNSSITNTETANEDDDDCNYNRNGKQQPNPYEIIQSDAHSS
jgi:uncharacterized repeat protein (TIGR01451 family)